MSGPLEDVVKQWTAKRKSALVIEILQGKMTVACIDPAESAQVKLLI